MNEKQIQQMKEIILDLKEKNDNLTIELDDISNQNIKLLKDKNNLLHTTKNLEKQNLNMSKKKVEDLILNKQNTHDKKKNIIFNIIFTIIVIIFLLIEFYIFIL